MQYVTPHARSCPSSCHQCGPQWWGSWWYRCSSASFLWCRSLLSAGWTSPTPVRMRPSPAGDRKRVQCFSVMRYEDGRLFSSTWMEKMHAILIAQRMPSRHSDATSVSSQSWRPTLKAARNGVHANWGTISGLNITFETVRNLPIYVSLLPWT